MRSNQTLNRWNFSIPAQNYQTNVTLPHTWNVDDAVMAHRGTGIYETAVFTDAALTGKRVFLHFGAANHTARVWVNDCFIGEHSRSGWTPFRMEISDAVRFGEENRIRVEVDNTHIDAHLPQGDNFDWNDDGGLLRRVTLQVREPDGIDSVHITEHLTEIKDGRGSGTLQIQTAFFDGADRPCKITVTDYADYSTVLERTCERANAALPFAELKLWSCFAPNLYLVTVETESDLYETRIGLRKIETRGEKVFLNHEELYLTGCEWMPGSHPDFGMAEPLDHSIQCLRQLKAAGCVFTRFHWQQADALFDWCDENGLLVQEEIPYWGHPKKATALQTEIAKQQADEMVLAHYNHPSIICWGVGNELGAELPETINYIQTLIAYFKGKDTRRLVNYVSNTLSRVENAEKDDGTLYGDIAMWNDYLGLWEPSDDIAAHMRRTCKKAAGMPLLVSEFGLCEPHFKGGDEERARILKERLALYAEIPNICGYMWFSLNDYRTHLGEEGEGKLRRRVHGSTDLYGNEKPSYRLLCELQKK